MTFLMMKNYDYLKETDQEMEIQFRINLTPLKLNSFQFI